MPWLPAGAFVSVLYNYPMTTPQGYAMNKEDYDRRELDRLMKLEEIERLKRQRQARLNPPK